MSRESFQWYVKNTTGLLFRLKTFEYMQDSLQDIVYFITELRLFCKKGFVHRIPFGFVYEGDDVTYDTSKMIPEKKNILQGVLKTTDLQTDKNINQAVDFYLKSVVKWKLFEQDLKVFGPVSCFVSNSLEKNIVIFGDIHDNFEVKGKFSHTEVAMLFRDFFGSSSEQNIDHFKYIVRKMKYAHFSQQQPNTNQYCFIWEFMLQLLFANADECVDVIVEDPLESSWESSSVTNYLLAVRHLFSLCPMITTPDSPFTHLVSECQDLFPNARYHRIDLRFAVHEAPLGNFANNEMAGALGTIFGLMEQFNNGEIDRVFNFHEVMRTFHSMDNTQDIEVLLSEFMRMFNAFQKSSLTSENFAVVFAKACLRHDSPRVTKRHSSKWFIFRTCMTDIYGLSRLFRQKMTPLSKRHQAQLPTTVCQENGATVKKAIVYIGEHHARIWQDVIVHLQRDATQHETWKQKNKKTRSLHFDAFANKPLFDSLWADDPQSIFADWMRRTAKDSITMQHLGLVSTRTISKFYVPFLAKKTREKQDADFFTTVPHQVTKLNAKLRETQRMCENADSDVMQNEFEKMDMRELNAVYLKNTDCYCAFAMFDLWRHQYAHHKSFRDPITRKIISDTEQDQILQLVNTGQRPEFYLDKPIRAPLSVEYLQTVVWSQSLQLVGSQVIPFDVVHVNVAMETLPNNKIVPYNFKTTQQTPTLHSHVFLLCFIQCNDATIREKLINALEEFITFAPGTFYDTTNNVVNNKHVHFNNFCDVQLWMPPHDNVERLTQLQHELLPYISFDWN